MGRACFRESVTVEEGSPVWGIGLWLVLLNIYAVIGSSSIIEMELRPSTKKRQNYFISFQYFLYYSKLYKRSISKHYSQLAGSVTENVAKLSFASERMLAAERAHNFVVDFCLQTTSTIVEVLRCRLPFRSPPSRLLHRTLTPMRCRTVAIHYHWYRSLCGRRPPLVSKAPWVSYSFFLTGTIFLSIPSLFACIHSKITVSSNHLLCGFYLNFLLQKPPSSSDLPLIGPRPWRHTPRLTAMHVVFRSLLKNKKACKLLQCNKAKLLEPASSNGLPTIQGSMLEPLW